MVVDVVNFVVFDTDEGTVVGLVDRHIDEIFPKLSATSSNDQASMVRTLVVQEWRSRKVTDIALIDVDRLQLRVAAGCPRILKQPVTLIKVA